MNRTRPTHLLLLSFIVLLIPGVSAAQTPKEKARKLFKEGSALYNKRDYAGALKKYRAAKEHLPGSFKIDLSIAAALLKVRPPNRAEAAMIFEEVLGRKDVKRRYKRDPKRKLRKLKKRLASLRVDCTEKGALVKVDGKAMGTIPLKTRIYLTPRDKPYTIKVESGDLQPFAQEVALKEAREHLIIKVIFARPVAPVKPPVEKPAPVKPPVEKPAPVKPPMEKPAPVEKPPVKPPEPAPVTQPVKPEPTTDDDPDELAAPPMSGGFFGNLLFGPAWADYGDPSLNVGTGVELGGEAGYHWRQPFGLKWLGFDVHGTVLYAPVSDADVDQQMGFLNVFAGGTVRFYFWRAFAGLRFSLGPSILIGATEKSFFFTGATSVSGTFVNLAVRPSVVIGWTVWKGLTVSVNPSLEYMPRIETFNENITGVLRFFLAVGLGWQA